MAVREALIIANETYSDPVLEKLQAPAGDALELSEVLGDPEIGNFVVKTLVDKPSYEVQRAIDEFFHGRRVDDLLLLYFSGHGIKDSGGHLFYAMSNTNSSFLRSTAVSANFVNDAMQLSRAKCQLLILDCCYSGAFARGMQPKGDRRVGIQDQFQTKDEFEGTGRIVLTASDAIQYSWEAGSDSDSVKGSITRAITGSSVRSLFTAAIIEGLKTGAADEDCDGTISAEELHHYAWKVVRQKNPSQEPMRWVFGATGGITVAQNRKAATQPAHLPRILIDNLDEGNPIAFRREAANELGRLLDGRNKSLALAAELKLKELLNDDSLAIQIISKKFLDRKALRDAGEPEIVAETARPQKERPEERREEKPQQETLQRDVAPENARPLKQERDLAASAEKILPGRPYKYGMDLNQSGNGAGGFQHFKFPADKGVTIPVAVWRTLIARTLFCVSPDESRPGLNAALLILNAKSITMVATDGHRLSVIEKPGQVPEGVSVEKRVLIPRTTLVQLQLLLDTTDAKHMKFSDDEQWMSFSVGNRTLQHVKPAGQFPNYEPTIPRDNSRFAVVHCSELAAALRRICQFADEQTGFFAVKMTLEENKLRINALSKKAGELEESIPIRYGGEPVVVWFNSFYLLDFLNVLGNEGRVRLELKDGQTAGLLSPEDFHADYVYRYVLMPMRP
jgi:DNA polymerase III beta subunit